jgi:hypothetical protein
MSNAEKLNDNLELCVIVDRIDRIIKSKNDQEILFDFLRKIYLTCSNSSSTVLNLKLIFTYSIEATSFTSTIDSINNLFKEHESPIKMFSFNLNNECFNQSNIMKLASVMPQQTIVTLNSVKEKLNNLFQANDLIDLVDLKLIDVLIYLLQRARYGIKQDELIDLLSLYIRYVLVI